MKARLDRKAKILTTAILCACTTLWANSVWAASGGSTTNGAYYGGRNTAASGKVEGKTVTIVDGDNYKGVYGGYAFKENWGDPDLEGASQANNNTVTINGANITGGTISLGWSNYDAVVAGGWANYTSGNIVNINGGEIKTSVYGGYSMVEENENKDHPEISANKVNINGGTITGGNVAGAYVDSARKDGNDNTIRNNSVTIENATIESTSITKGNIYGAWADDDDAKLEGNKVIINSGANVTTGKSEWNSGVGIFGAYGQGQHTSATNNIVEINGGIINANIYGAYANVANSENMVSGNQVIIRGGKINGNIYAADSNSGDNLSNNSIFVSGENTSADLSKANLYGWDNEGNNYVKTGINLTVEKYTGQTGEIAKFNNVYIQNESDITVNSVNLYTHWDENGNEVCGNFTIDNSIVNANEIGYVNQLNVQNGTTLKVGEIDLYNNSELNGDLIVNSANIEIDNLRYSKNITLTNSNADIKNLDYFDSLTIDNNNQKIVNLGNVTGQRGGNISTITTDSKFTADSIKDLKELNIDMTAINWEKDTAVIEVSGTADFTGTAISATGNLAAAAGTEVQNGDTMSFIKAGTLTGAKAEDINIDNLQIGFATEAQVEVQDGDNSIDFVITGAQQANEQADIIGESRTAAIAFVNQGSDILNNAFGLMDDGKYGIKPFAAAHGNYSKYETGSHIRVNGWSMIAGVGNSDKLEDSTFSWGVFFENGSGNYRTYNDYNGYNLRGFGSAVYNGGGALARYRSNAGNYAEIGLRAGMLKNSLGNAVADGYGVQGGYDEETSYYGAHLGVGHIFAVDENSNVDVYGKYFYNHHESKDLNILGDEVRFDSADSNRLRLGLRYNQNDGNAFSHYYGLAWDYEFNGDANVTAAGFDTGNPSLKGSTAVIEAGIHYAPDNSPWSIDLGLQGYGGQRDGFSGTMQLNYSFN